MAETVPNTDLPDTKPDQPVDAEEGWNQEVDEKKRKGEKRLAQVKEEKTKKKGNKIG